MRAGPWMPKERADFVGRLRRKNVLELTRLLLDFRLAVHRQTVGKEPLGQPVPPDNAPGALAPRGVSSTISVPSPTDAATGFSASWQGFTNGL